jgi:LuxR family maltose regulon positive regulatory protein
MRGNDPAGGAAAAGPLILDYLRSELVSHLSEEDSRFLTRSSVLERLSGSLCDAVTQMDGSTDRLERIEAANLFVIPLDRERQWYRMQAVVRNVLAAELERLEPGIARGLQSRAASWSAGHGDLSGALEYARAARDMPQLIELIESSVLPFAATAQPASVERLLILLDDPEILRQHPALAAIGALAWGMTGRPELAERWASAAARSSPTSSAWRSLLHAVMQPAGPDDMAAAAGDALARMPFESRWRAPALLTLGIASILGGAEHEAMLMLRQAGDVAAAADAPAIEAAALGCESLAAAALGQWAVADALAHAGRRLVDEREVHHEVISLFALAASARAALRGGNWAGARSELELANTLLPRLTHAVAAFAVPLRITFARIYHALGELAAAHRLLDEIDEIFHRQPQLDLCRYDAEELRSELIDEEHGATGHTSPLTAAELRLLPLLVTHLSFREIAEQLYVSRNTVKTQAISVYRKLGVSSRADAIGRASTLGLVASDEKVR